VSNSNTQESRPLTLGLDKYLGGRLVELHTLPGFSGYRLFLPDRVLESADPETLVEEARRLMTEHLGELIRLAGAENAEIDCERADRRVTLRDGSRLFLGATLTFTARGLEPH